MTASGAALVRIAARCEAEGMIMSHRVVWQRLFWGAI
jgi:hypothetical protein